jgi:hypothetical protein
MTVDEFVETKVQPEHRPIVATVRALMSDTAPKAREAISYGMPTYGQNKPVAWINASKSGITFGFRQGAYFEDKYGLLRGVAKHARNVRMKTLDDVNKPALRYYIKQAVKLDRA